MERLNKKVIIGMYWPIANDPDFDRFCFDGKEEFLLYVKLCRQAGITRNVIWEKNDAYYEACMHGCFLFDEGQFDKALIAYKTALESNPIGITARFEMCECFLALHQLSEAKLTLLEMTAFLDENTYIARFYRRFGYIAIEQKEYRLAAACFLFSQEYEKSTLADKELLYLHSVVGVLEPVGDPKDFIQHAGIPILRAMEVPAKDTKSLLEIEYN